MKFKTRAIHSGQKPDKTTGAVIVPVYQTSTFEQEGIEKNKGYDYSRSDNPTRKSLEILIASLEGGKYGLAFASGLAATNAVLHLLKKGDHIIAGNDLYGGTYRLLESVFKPWGVEVTYADINDASDFGRSVKENTRLIWIETPTNPLLKIADIRAIGKIAKEHNIILAVDNTFASPYFQTPIKLGAQVVVHSTTKYLAGHSDIIGGAVVTSDEALYNEIKFYQNAAGAVPGIWDVWLTIRGIKTLAVRMKEHEKNALYLAKFLEKHPKVEKVYYPGLPSHENYELAKEQMKGFGGMISIEIKGDYKDVELFFSKLKLIFLAESLGGVESLACYPPRMTHGSLSESERHKRGIKDNLIRISVGIEDKEDLKFALEKALNEECFL